jgi:Phage integrase family
VLCTLGSRRREELRRFGFVPAEQATNPRFDRRPGPHHPNPSRGSSAALLHDIRSVPLHPLLVGLINDYRAWRGPTPSGLLVERNDHKPFDRRTIHRYVQAVARRAGVGDVHPHQLRHTLATQCLNRGMSLEAIAAVGPPVAADDPRLRPHR